MALKRGQIDKYAGPGERKLSKHGASRARRRAERRDPENAPGRMTEGYAS